MLSFIFYKRTLAEEDHPVMWTSTLEISIRRVLPTQILGFFWSGAYFSSFAPLQVKNLPRQPLVSGSSKWVRVHNRLAGIGGSDLHMVFASGGLRTAPAALPNQSYIYPGREVVGEVIEIGDQVQNLQVGDRVVLQSAPNCLSIGIQPPCQSCVNGNYNLCEHADFPGPQQIGGGWSEEMLVHEQQLFHIPDAMEDEQAVLLEPTAVAMHAVLRRPPQANEKVLIVGAGTVGLLILQIIRTLAPQAEVSVLARHNFQVEQATRMGAEHILYTHDSYEGVQKATGARLYTGSMGNKMLLGGYDLIYNTVGTRQAVHDSLRWARAGGTVVMVAPSMHHLLLDLSPIWHQEVNLLGTTGHGMENWPLGTSQRRSTFAITSDLITNGVLHPERLITHHFALSSFREALQTAINKKASRSIKVVFDASLLPASSVPGVRAIARPHQPVHQSATQAGIFGQDQFPLLDEDLIPVQIGQKIPSTEPSHFTMAQSEDFTADFDNTQFITPRQKRPPAPLQFYNTSEDMAQADQQMDEMMDSPTEEVQAVKVKEDHPAPASPND